MQTPSGRPDRTLVVILSVIALVVILALVVVFTRGAPAALDPSTPEGVVQTYTNAVIASDRGAATELLAKSVRDNCERTDIGTTSGIRLTLISTNVKGDTAVIRVAVSADPGSGPFGGSGYESEDTFTLVKESGDWKIDSAPWMIAMCYNQGGNQ